MKLRDIQQNYPELGQNFEGLGKSGDLYLRFEGNHEWSVIHLNCFEKFLRWLGFYASTRLETIAQKLSLEEDLPAGLSDKIKSCWNRTYSTSRVCPLENGAARQQVPSQVDVEATNADATALSANMVERIQTMPLEDVAARQQVPPQVDVQAINADVPDYVKTMPPPHKMDFEAIFSDRPRSAYCRLANNIKPDNWKIGNTTLWIAGGDIFNAGVPCIVNAANQECLGGAGIDGAIHEAAGSGLYDLCLALPIVQGGQRAIRCRRGGAVITGSANLSERGILHIIHAVGPSDGQSNRRELLESTYRSIMQVAEENNIRSLAIPAISTGIYRFPFGEATQIALKTIKAYLQAHPGKFDTVALIFLQNTVEEAEKCGWAIHIARKMWKEQQA